MERLEAELRAQLGRFGPAAGLGPIVEAWPKAVGDAIASTAWPARLARDGTLLVHAKDSVWAFELTQRAEEIRARLGEAAPRALRFVVGPIPEAAVETRPEAAATLPQPGPEAAAWAAELAAEIENEELRERVAKAAAFSLAQAAADRRF